jgi:hypothetical protein
MLPTVEKVQQLPQLPWFFTGVTTPKSRQFQEAGTPLRISSMFSEAGGLLVAEQFYEALRLKWVTNSSSVMSEYSLRPFDQI